MEKFLESVSFSAVDLSVLETSKPQLFKRILADVVNMYDNKIIRNITPTTVYPISELEKAMRQMQSGKHTGKIVIEANSDSIVQVCKISMLHRPLILILSRLYQHHPQRLSKPVLQHHT